MWVGFQQLDLAALPPGRPVNLCKGSLLNVESGLNRQGNSCFPLGFNPPPPAIKSLGSRLIAEVTRILRLLYLVYQWLLFV